MIIFLTKTGLIRVYLLSSKYVHVRSYCMNLSDSVLLSLFMRSNDLCSSVHVPQENLQQHCIFRATKNEPIDTSGLENITL